MAVNRRDILKIVALAGIFPLFGCERVTSEITKNLGQTIPPQVFTASGDYVDKSFHLLSRATYGVWPGDWEYLQSIGKSRWLSEQLNPETIDDRACDLRARRFETLWLDPGTCAEYKKPVLRDELVRHMLLRAVYSKRQLFEVMVGFWSDHLNIDVNKGDAIYAKAADDRKVIRAHALGKFRDLIASSATSAAMLIYLDGKENRRATPQAIPNENYARELLELHTMGVDGGYTQKDVFEAARCLTGWRIHSSWQRGVVYFDHSEHDNGAKFLLGHQISAGQGAGDLDSLLDILCNHPSTAMNIATKLVTHFVADLPPPDLVQEVARVFISSKGDIRLMLATIFNAEEFDQHIADKVKKPFHFIASCLRAVAADTYAHSSVTEYLTRMGHGPFEFPTPDGYPDQSSYWVSTLLWRWNFALSLCRNEIAEVSLSLPQLYQSIAALADQQKPEVEKLFAHFIGRRPDAEELKIFAQYQTTSQITDSQSELAGLILSSPAFQRC